MGSRRLASLPVIIAASFFQRGKCHFMLNKNALQQLSQLKTTLRTSKTMAQGVVRTTTRRFGFVRLDDGRDAFIDPEQMLRVLPDDRIEIEVITNSKDQLEAKLEKLINSPLKEFVGRYIVKGPAHFVEPDVPQFNRWLFIPPQERKNCQAGDYIHCAIARHPFHSEGKGQVRVLNRLGKPEDPGIESRYIAAKYNLPAEWPQTALDQAQAINGILPAQEAEQEDLTHLPFVTIDAESTRDMDDALYIEANISGWELITAIADPTRHIEFNSPLEIAARTRANTVYLLGQSLTMLPVELSHDTYSLVAEQNRPALICRMQIAHDGTVTGYNFGEATIRSHQKLSYQSVHEFLSGNTEALDAPENIKTLLHELQKLTDVRTAYRSENALVMEDKPDYFYVLNEQRRIDRVEKRLRNSAHRLVEEAMLATNICAGDFFAKHPGYGIFSSHVGFRPERLDDAVALITEDKPGYAVGDLTCLADFQRLIRTLRLNLDHNEKNPALQSILQRMLQAGALSFEAQAHFGLGFAHYATITSPIRRYHDFYNHLALKRILQQQPPLEFNTLEQLQEQLATGRTACRQLELWLCCQFMAQQIGSVHAGIITQINSAGIGVRLDDIGVEGFALLANKEAGIKPAFDARRLSLTYENKTYRLDQQVFVMLTAVDVDQRRISLQLVDEETAARLSVWTAVENESHATPAESPAPIS